MKKLIVPFCAVLVFGAAYAAPSEKDPRDMGPAVVPVEDMIAFSVESRGRCGELWAVGTRAGVTLAFDFIGRLAETDKNMAAKVPSCAEFRAKAKAGCSNRMELGKSDNEEDKHMAAHGLKAMFLVSYYTDVEAGRNQCRCPACKFRIFDAEGPQNK